ncbi:MAG TPA: SemiSWEET transporter [Candidatus Competibacteraceae bacterium]|nr:SemiSWEET transporter [Candidatus Competibacteraceae bacterium]
MLDTLGLVAGFLTTSAFLPQVIHTWRSRSVADISLAMYLIFCVGIGLWLVYGVLLGALPIILANAVTLVLTIAVLGMKLAWSGRSGAD